MLKPLIMWGASGQAVVLEEFLNSQGFELMALLDREPECVSPFPLVPFFRGSEAFARWLPTRPDGDVHFVVAVGGARGRDRCALATLLCRAGLRAATLVHPTAFVAASARIGAGSVVLAQAAVCARANVGENVIVNTGASVDHECVLEAGVHIGPGAILAGRVVVGSGAFVASGATVGPGVRIGAQSIIGAGAVVLADVPSGVVALGAPARVVRRRADG